MALTDKAFSVLVVSTAENFNSTMAAMLPESRYQPVRYAGSISAAQRAVAQRSYDFVIINTPLSDDPGVRFAIDCSTSGKALVLLLVRNEIHADIYDKVARHGVFTLPKPMSRQAMDTALRWLTTAKTKLQSAEKKSTKMEDKMEEIRLVNKAKWLLISKEGLLEPEAHRTIEKEAMDRCVTKKEIAKEIIDKYN